MQHTLHWGQASKSNPGLLSAQSELQHRLRTLYHYRGGRENAEGADEECEEKRGSLEEGGGLKEDGRSD